MNFSHPPPFSKGDLGGFSTTFYFSIFNIHFSMRALTLPDSFYQILHASTPLSRPPSIGRETPVMYEACSEQRNAVTAAISSG